MFRRCYQAVHSNVGVSALATLHTYRTANAAWTEMGVLSGCPINILNYSSRRPTHQHSKDKIKASMQVAICPLTVGAGCSCCWEYLQIFIPHNPVLPESDVATVFKTINIHLLSCWCSNCALAVLKFHIHFLMSEQSLPFSGLPKSFWLETEIRELSQHNQPFTKKLENFSCLHPHTLLQIFLYYYTFFFLWCWNSGPSSAW